MEQFTQEEALKEIFSSKELSAKMTVYKHRYKNGKLAQKAIDEILKDNNFVVIQETLYVKA
jgi:hypothetical protein